MRDPDMHSVYDVEQDLGEHLLVEGGAPIGLPWGDVPAPEQQRLADLAAVEEFANGLLRSPEVSRRWGTVPPVRVRRKRLSRGVSVVYRYPGVIRYPRDGDWWSLTVLIACHEVAHHVTYHHHGVDAEGHGEEFRAVMCHLTGVALGGAVERLLRRRYDQAGLGVAARTHESVAAHVG